MVGTPTAFRASASSVVCRNRCLTPGSVCIFRVFSISFSLIPAHTAASLKSSGSNIGSFLYKPHSHICLVIWNQGRKNWRRHRKTPQPSTYRSPLLHLKIHLSRKHSGGSSVGEGQSYILSIFPNSQPPPDPSMKHAAIIQLLLFWSLLQPASEVWGKVMFLHLFVILFTRGVGFIPACNLQGVCIPACNRVGVSASGSARGVYTPGQRHP